MVNYFIAPTQKQTDIVFDALANTKRRAMIDSLSECPATVSALAAEHGLTLPAIHKHIRILERAGLLNRHKVGRVNFVALNRTGLGVAKVWLDSHELAWGKGQKSLEHYIAQFMQQQDQ